MVLTKRSAASGDDNEGPAASTSFPGSLIFPPASPWSKRDPVLNIYQEPIIRSLHMNCILQSTLSVEFFNFPRKHADVCITCVKKLIDFPRFPPLLKCFRVAGIRTTAIFKKTRKLPWELLLKMKRYGTGLKQRVIIQDRRSGLLTYTPFPSPFVYLNL